jgi:hypothetical protein
MTNNTAPDRLPNLVERCDICGIWTGIREFDERTCPSCRRKIKAFYLHGPDRSGMVQELKDMLSVHQPPTPTGFWRAAAVTLFAWLEHVELTGICPGRVESLPSRDRSPVRANRDSSNSDLSGPRFEDAEVRQCDICGGVKRKGALDEGVCVECQARMEKLSKRTPSNQVELKALIKDWEELLDEFDPGESAEHVRVSAAYVLGQHRRQYSSNDTLGWFKFDIMKPCGH